LDEGRRLSEYRVCRSTSFLVPHQLCIFFLFCSPTPLSGRTTFAGRRLFCCGLLLIPAVDFGEDLSDARVPACVDEVAKKVG
jgi:hypothetical protein